MEYQDVRKAYFIDRPNRFIANCRLAGTNESVVVHVKNTGRGKEVLLPGAEVGLSYQPSPKRKTAYDLITIKKGEMWINIDSQVPNSLAFEGLVSGQIHLTGITGNLTTIKREVRYGNSKFDLYFETDTGERGFVEVKGMTLENQSIGAFPDAPTLRGLKHVHELTAALKEGYHCFVLFIVQFEEIQTATIHRQMQPEFWRALHIGMKDDLRILAYNCIVDRGSIRVKGPVPFDLDQPFIDPVEHLGGEQL